jgi:hexosaminidase
MFSCVDSGKVNKAGIIPKPIEKIDGNGLFELNSNTVIVATGEAVETATLLKDFLKKATGFDLKLASEAGNNSIVLSLDGKQSDEEGYKIVVESDRVVVEASATVGLFYGTQSLRMLLPPEIESDTKVQNIDWIIPAVTINDEPRFEWRGMMLDCSRHFFPVSHIKRLIDQLAAHKMNSFHWHLVDDQGWRVEIKKYPKLTENSAWRVDHEDKHWSARPAQQKGEKATYGGFYSQDDIKEIVAYAAERHINIVPEIEMPAHVTCVFAAYPEFSCKGIELTVPPGGLWPITDIYCAGNDKTFEFLEDVLTEVMELFPSEYIHIGGDEATKTEWKTCKKCQARKRKEGLKDEHELQSYFIKRIEKFINSKGRKLIGWDEILEGGLAPQATVMSWRGFKGGIEAARSGHDVVMSPTSHCYFDYFQGPQDLEPTAFGGNLPISKVYTFEPVPAELNEEEAKHILGGQANLWTEHVPTPEHSDYMTFPRLAAMSEALWSSKENRDWDCFVSRLDKQLKRYESGGVNFANSLYNVKAISVFDSTKRSISIELKPELLSGEIRYTLDGADPTANSTLYSEPFELKQTAVVKTAQFKDGKMISKIMPSEFFIHKATSAKVEYLEPYTRRYKGQGDITMVNSTLGSKNHNDGQWHGYKGNINVKIDLGSIMGINKVDINFFQSAKSWILLPQKVTVLISTDGENFKVTGDAIHNYTGQEGTLIHRFTVDCKEIARYVQVKAENTVLPEWHSGAGSPAWMFVDEIVVE